MRYKFCPRCGGKLKLSRPEWEKHAKAKKELICTDCGFIFWQNSKPTAAIIFTDTQNRLLLVRRSADPKKGMWDLPGGFLEEGEDPVKGAKREIKEELGVVPKISKMLGIYLDTYGDELNQSIFNVYYLGNVNGILKPSDDIDKAKWFKINNLPARLAFKSNETAINDWLKGLGLPKKYR